MSWSVTAVYPADDFNITALEDKALAQDPACGNQFQAAANAMQAVIESGAVGAAGKQFNVALSGHCTNDALVMPMSVTISVTEK